MAVFLFLSSGSLHEAVRSTHFLLLLLLSIPPIDMFGTFFPSGRDKLTETGDGARVSNCPFSSLLYPPKLCPNDRQKFPSSRDRPANTLSLLLTHHYYYSYYCAWPPTVLLPIRPVIECPSDANSCPADVQFVTIGLVRSNNKEYLFCVLLPGRIVRRN